MNPVRRAEPADLRHHGRHLAEFDVRDMHVDPARKLRQFLADGVGYGWPADDRLPFAYTSTTRNPNARAATHWRASADTNTSASTACAAAMWMAAMPRRVLASSA